MARFRSMNCAVGLIVAAAITGCGDNLERPGLTANELLYRLRTLPGVTVEASVTSLPDVTLYILHFTQPVDHHDPSLGTFQQEVSLLHRDERAPVPMVVYTSGYDDADPNRRVELTKLLDANQVSIEHRFFGTSRPLPLPTDWTKLTIWQMAADEHVIIEALHSIYAGAFVTTGISKGGMTAVFHRRWFPDDVDGTVAYVAPISFGAPDGRYRAFIASIGPPECRQKVRDVAVQMLKVSRDDMMAHAAQQTENTYTRIALGPAVESSIVSLEWTFWQYFGVSQCKTVPAVTVSSDDLFQFLDRVSPIADNDDQKLAVLEPYYYESYTELGYPAADNDYLTPYLWYSDSDYANELPVPKPAYDRKVMQDIDDFVEQHGDRLLFVYGGWDPWTAGKFVLGDAQRSDVFIQTEGTHGAQITSLGRDDRVAALAMIQDWTGVVPIESRARSAAAETAAAETARVPPRMPPALLRALRAQK